MNWVIIAFIIALGALGLVLKSWHRRLMEYLYSNHRAKCERVDAKLFERNERWPNWTDWGIWTWSGLRFFLFKEYQVIEDPKLLSRARRFRFALGIWMLTLVIVGTVALYFSPR
jgi:hypothetical protein